MNSLLQKFSEKVVAPLFYFHQKLAIILRVETPDQPAESPPQLYIFSYRPAGFEGLGCFAAAVFAAVVNVLNLFSGYFSSVMAILITMLVNLAFAALSGLVWCLIDEVKIPEEKIGADKIFETLYWQHPRSGHRRVLKQYEYWRSDFSGIHVQHGRGVSTISLHGKDQSLTLDRVFADRQSAAARARQIADQLDLPLLPN